MEHLNKRKPNLLFFWFLMPFLLYAGYAIGKLEGAEISISNLQEITLYSLTHPSPFKVTKLSDTDTAPVERIRWAEAILDLAGWVTNMALFMEREEAADKPGETWMVKHAIRRYRQSMEELRRIMAVMK